MLFSDIIGYEPIKQELRRSVREGHIAHAQLFSGVSGTGKLPLALAYAQYIACEHRSETDSCGKCPACLQYSRLQHPDLHFSYPYAKADSIKLSTDVFSAFRDMVLQNPYCDFDDWRLQLKEEKKLLTIYDNEAEEVLHTLRLKAFGNGYKVMIIWQADRLNQTGANTLLKLLEEPPEGTLLILITEYPDRLLPTVRSRLRQIHLMPLSMDEISSALIQRLHTDPQEAIVLARLSQGSFRNAERLATEKKQREEMDSAFEELMRNAWRVGTNRDFTALQTLSNWAKTMAETKHGREYLQAFLQHAQKLIRENFIANLNIPQINYLSAAEQTFSARFAPFINERNVEALSEEFSRAERQIMQNGNAKIILFDLCLQCIVQIKK